MGRQDKKLLYLFIVLSTVTLPYAFGYGQAPGLPHRFYGQVYFASGKSVEGLVVEAVIDGVVVGRSVIHGGRYGLSPDLLVVSDNAGNRAGKKVRFRVDGILADQSYIFSNGSSTKLDLFVDDSSAPTATPTPAVSVPTATPTPVPQPAVSSASTQGVASQDYPQTDKDFSGQVDVNSDGAVNNKDLDIILDNWGVKGTGIKGGDINSDGIVNIFDFNLLMVYWSG